VLHAAVMPHHRNASASILAGIFNTLLNPNILPKNNRQAIFEKFTTGKCICTDIIEKILSYCNTAFGRSAKARPLQALAGLISCKQKTEVFEKIFRDSLVPTGEALWPEFVFFLAFRPMIQLQHFLTTQTNSFKSFSFDNPQKNASPTFISN
jgi:hypothetical protein